MEFSPTATDYIFLLAFTSLFFLSGAVTSVWVLHKEAAVKRPTSSELETRRGMPGNLSFLESLLFILMSAIVVTSFVLLLTAQLGVFRIRHWLFALLIYDLVLILHLRLWRRSHWSTCSLWSRPEKSDWLLLPLCLLAAYMFYRPSESIHTRDPGGYVNIAVKLSDTGSLKFNDPDFRQFDSKIRQSLFLPAPLSDAPYPQALPGFQLLNSAAGTLVPRYFHLFPLWLTLCFKLWRFPAVFALNAFLGIISVLILIPLAHRLFACKLVGWFAAFLLTVNLAEIWIVRSPFSEILAQVLLLGGIWTLSVGTTEKLKGACVSSGLLLGLSLFVRVDSVIALVAILLFATVMLSISKSTSFGLVSSSVSPFPGGDYKGISISLLWFLVPLGLASAYALLHTWLFAYPYVWNVIDTFGKLSRPFWQLVLFTVVVIGLVFLVAVWQRARLAEVLIREVNRQRLLTSAVLLLSLLFIYAYLFRPHLASHSDNIPLPFPQKGSIRFYDEISLVRLGWYLSPLGIFLAWLGSCITFDRLLKRGELVLLPFVLTLSFFAVFYLYKSRAFPENYWVVRRYVEIVIPGFLLLSSLSLVSLTKCLQRVFNKAAESGFRQARLPILIGGGAVLVLVALQLKDSYPLLRQTEWANTFRQLENLAGAIQDADVVLMEGGQFQDFFSSPLKFIFRKTVYSFANDKPDVQAFDTVMDEWTGQGRRVYLLASEEQTDLRSTRYLFVPGERFLFRTQVVERVYEHIPQAMENLQFTVQIYQAVKRLQPEDPSSVNINIGYNFGTRTEGFYTTEFSSEYEPFRWSSAKSNIELPSLPASHDGLLSLRWRQVLPEGVPSTPVRVILNGSLISEAQPRSIFEVAQWRIPRPLLNREGKNVVQFSSSAYSPARQGGEDIRELAFMLNYAKLQILAPITVSRPYVVDFGAGSDVLDAGISGFHGREGNSYRWTGPAAQVALPVPLSNSPSLEVSLGAIKASPDPSFRQFLALSLNGIQIGKQELLGAWDEFRTYHFPIPSGIPLSPNTVVKIAVSPAWTPRFTDYYTDDWRTLGCAIDWLKIGAKE